MAWQPCDWDGETLCWEDGCFRPATHRRLEAADEQYAYFRRFCCEHSLEEYEPS